LSRQFVEELQSRQMEVAKLREELNGLGQQLSIKDQDITRLQATHEMKSREASKIQSLYNELRKKLDERGREFVSQLGSHQLTRAPLHLAMPGTKRPVSGSIFKSRSHSQERSAESTATITGFLGIPTTGTMSQMGTTPSFLRSKARGSSGGSSGSGLAFLTTLNSRRESPIVSSNPYLNKQRGGGFLFGSSKKLIFTPRPQEM